MAAAELPTQSPFRADINGLRALAVTLVVLFHARTPGFGGGFVGVDVFFVISGYLMTQIIQQRLAAERFSLGSFYLDRTWRIVPALLAMCALLLVFAWLYISPTQLSKLGQQVCASVLFLSNFLFLHEAGYFDSASHQKLLLHTWSLSVEWQFYLLYPLWLVWLLRSGGAGKAARALIVGALLSAILAVLLSYRSPDAVFYLLPTRAWELFAGALACLFSMANLPAWQRKLAGLTGLALIATACWLLAEFGTLRILGMVLAVAGTSLVFWCRAPVSFLLGNGAAQFLGRISYSLYFWHWPIVIASRNWIADSNPARIPLIALASIAAGWVSFYLFERIRRRSGRADSLLPSNVILGSAFALMGIVGAWAAINTRFETDGHDQRILLATRAATDVNPRRECWDQTGRSAPDCIFGATEGMWG